MENKNEEKVGATITDKIGKVLAIIVYSFFGLIILIFLLYKVIVFFGGEDKNTPNEVAVKTNCIDVPDDVIKKIESALTIKGDGSLRNVQAVKSKDFSSVYFISGDLQGSGLEGDNDIATFATNKMNYLGLTLSVDAVASEFSDWPAGKTTDWNLNMSNHGAIESQKCVRNL